MKIEDLRNNHRLLRNIIEQNFPLNEIVPEYAGLTQNTANVFCVFHPNHGSPAGKLYWDDEKEILVLHCFSEHRTFTSYDYVKLILCDKKYKYTDPVDFLIKNMSEQELKEIVKLAELNYEDMSETAIAQKIEYIENTYNEYDNVVDFINALYSA